MKRVRIGLLGCGTVGGGFVRLVERERSRIRDRYNVELNLARILVRDSSKERPGVDRALLTTSALDVIDRDCDLIVEAIGGVHSAGTFVRRALARKRSVVTANKALLAAAGGELFRAASRNRVSLGFEASVCGGVPVIAALRRGLAGDTIERITGILNGTSNYVLCRMEEGLSFTDAVARAQELGFAERDATLDLSGEDSAQKLRILANVAFGDGEVRKASVCGIGGDVRHVRGTVVRLIAEARRVAGGVELCVEPRRFTYDHPFARVRDEQNAVVIRGRAVGDVWLGGAGAGASPTAAALLSDVLECVRDLT
jgi:homoserine dehydrogenase